ncbi:MAG: LacI family transcriptional regulator [Bacteroidota bacterium]|nr:LacI family transcriptional regulator [Bacteroidota bacterium]
MKKGVTLKDISIKLHMSVSTVSKALSDDISISAATRERVKKLAMEWQYVPNEAARHFQQNKSFTLGLIIPDLLDQFYVLAINGVEEVAAKNEYNVIVSQSHENVMKEEKIVDIMIRNRVDGVIIAITKHTKDMAPFHKLIYTGIPVVFFARAPVDPSFNYVSANNEDGAMKAMDFLIKKGHRRIAHLMGPPSMSVSQLRLEGYKKGLEKNNLPFDPLLVKEIDFTTPSTNKAMKQLIMMKHPPTAIFVFKNYVSLDAINYLKNNYPAKLDVMDMVGFGNLPLIQYLDHKPAASIEENSHLMGFEAAQLLFKFLNVKETEEKEIRHHIKVPCRVVIHR